MPKGDGPGPGGLGPGTGRGRGWCRGFLYPGNRFSAGRLGFLGAVIPLVGAVLRDAVNPDGLLRSVSRKLLLDRGAVPHKKKDAVAANYTVIDEKELKPDRRYDTDRLKPEKGTPNADSGCKR